jgi:hypothetical protein
MARRITAADMMLSYRYGPLVPFSADPLQEYSPDEIAGRSTDEDFGALFPAAQTDRIGLWISTIPAPFDDIEDEDEYGVEWSYDAELYGAQQKDEDDGALKQFLQSASEKAYSVDQAKTQSLMNDSSSMMDDLKGALDKVGDVAVKISPRVLGLRRRQLLEVATNVGVPVGAAKKGVDGLITVLGKVGWTLPPPWGAVIIGSAAAISTTYLIVKLVKARKLSKSQLKAFLVKNDVPDAEGFERFMRSAFRMNSDERTALATRYGKILKRSTLRQRREDAISAKLRILTALQVLDVEEEIEEIEEEQADQSSSSTGPTISASPISITSGAPTPTASGTITSKSAISKGSASKFSR